jgi:hypothetical protein
MPTWDEFEVPDDFDMGSCIDRCNVMVEAMLKEYKKVFGEPALPPLLTQGAYEAEK